MLSLISGENIFLCKMSSIQKTLPKDKTVHKFQFLIFLDGLRNFEVVFREEEERGGGLEQNVFWRRQKLAGIQETTTAAKTELCK